VLLLSLLLSLFDVDAVDADAMFMLTPIVMTTVMADHNTTLKIYR